MQHTVRSSHWGCHTAVGARKPRSQPGAYRDLGVEAVRHLFCTYRPVPKELGKKKSPGNYPELFSLREINEALINFLSNTAN